MDELERMERALAAAHNAATTAKSSEEAQNHLQAAQYLSREMRAMLKAINPNVDAPIDYAAQAATELAKTTGPGEAAIVSTGRKLYRIGGGIADLVSGGPSEETKQVRQREDAAFRPLQQERPFATAGGEAIPYVAVPPSFSIPSAALTVGAIEAAQPGTAKER